MGPVDLSLDHIAKLIQSAVGPVFLISGVGVTLNVLTSRLARVVDRAHGLELERGSNTDAAARADLDARLAVMARRARYINTAITLCTISALLTAVTVMLLFSNAFVPVNFGTYIAILFVLSMLSLAIAYLVFLIEVRIATAALRIGAKRNG
jgi:CBS domain containing-hemolysin-like protein